MKKKSIFDRLSTTVFGEIGKIKYSDFHDIAIETIDIYVGQTVPIIWRLFYNTPPRPPPWANLEPPVREYLMYEMVLPPATSFDEDGKPLDELLRIPIGRHLEEGSFMSWKTYPPMSIRVTINPFSIRHDLLGMDIVGSEY